MDDTGTYGQFGNAVYDYDERDWHFSRSADTIHTLRSLGEPRTIIEPCDSRHSTGFPQDGKEGPTRRRENQIKALIKLHPELQPAYCLLPDLARISEAVEEASDRHDPAKGNLLAFGTITDELAKRQVEVVAFPTGPTGSDLRIVQVQKQRRGWYEYEGTYLRVPTIYGEAATWEGPGVPIQSIVFATPLESGDSCLAVRLMTETLIFRPVLRKTRLPGGSRMDVNLLHTIGLDQTRNSPPADATFNPWYSRHFAVLNQAGVWTVFELEGKRTERIKKLCTTGAARNQMKASKRLSNQGWGRIIFSSASTVAVCNRKRVAFFEVAQQGPIELVDLDIGLDSVSQILDMIAVPSQPEYTVMISSVHIIVHHVETDRDENVVVNKIAEIRHFRNSDDISLRASCFSEEENAFLFLRSDVDPTILVYRLHLNGSRAITVDDPTAIVPSSPGSVMSSAGVSALHLSVVDVKGSPNDALQRTELVHVTTLHKHFSVKQTLHVASASGDRLTELMAPSWERNLTKSVPNVSDDGFIIDDDEIDETHTEIVHVEPISNFAMRLKKQAHADSRDWTVQYEHSVRRLNNVDVADVTDVEEVIEVIQETLKQGGIEKTVPIRLIRELAEGEITLRDTQGVSARLEKLLLDHAASPTGVTAEDEMMQENPYPRLTLRSMVLPPTLCMPDDGVLDHLRVIFERISQTWLPPATHMVSDIVQHSREQLARRVAIEVRLASLIVRLVDPVTEQLPQSQSQTESQSQAWELPVRPGGPPSTRTTPSLYFEASSQPGSSRLPTPSDSAETSVATASNSAVTRLSRYTTFKGKPSPPPLPRRLNRVLAHWSIGADPSTYDWTSASRLLSRRAAAEEAEGEELTEKERSRLQRRTERHLRRQRREAEETQRIQLLSSKAPEIVSGSQPGRLVRATSQLGVGEGDSQNQSQSQGRQAVASQVLPGKHGGRPPKKKRKSGF